MLMTKTAKLPIHLVIMYTCTIIYDDNIRKNENEGKNSYLELI